MLPRARAPSPTLTGSTDASQDDVFAPEDPPTSAKIAMDEQEQTMLRQRMSQAAGSDPYLDEAKIIDWATGVVSTCSYMITSRLTYNPQASQTAVEALAISLERLQQQRAKDTSPAADAAPHGHKPDHIAFLYACMSTLIII